MTIVVRLTYVIDRMKDDIIELREYIASVRGIVSHNSIKITKIRSDIRDR